jgi:hypothetical protein
MGLCVLAFLLCCWPMHQRRNRIQIHVAQRRLPGGGKVADNLQIAATRGAEKLKQNPPTSS